VIVKTFIVQPFYIPSGSMEQTLHGCPSCNGDKILVNKPIYDLRSPHPGDIIVFSLPEEWPKTPGESPVAPQTNVITAPIRWFGQLVGVIPPDREDLVKRVIAVGGQTIKCCDKRGRVEVSDNGVGGPFRSLDEPFTYLAGGSEMSFTAVTVPHGRLFVLGDHRTDSADSRFHCVAGDGNSTASNGQKCDPVASTVPISNVIGKAFVIAWPPSRWRTLGTPHTFKASALSAAASLTSGLPLFAGAFGVLPLWYWRRRTRT
jgi:signal peptidase I